MGKWRITAEALRNAFRHSEAKQVEVEIRYHEQELRLRVRDDGKGIDASLLSKQETAGHFGLRGMRERAGLIGGTLVVWSEVSQGTELELRLPASAAYASTARSSWFRKSAGKV